MFNKILTYVFALAVITTVFMYANVAKAQVVTKGLVSYWSFDKADIKDKTVKDVWGDNDGTLKRNARIVGGQVREALECPDKEDYVDLGTTPIIAPDAAEFTIMAWIKTADTSVGGVFGQFSTPGATGSDTNHWLHSNGFDEYPPSGGGCQFSKDIKNDQWHHIAVVLGGGVWTMYLDGQSDKTCPPETYAGQAPSEIQIGSRGSFKPESYAFKGLIDEVGIYDQALSKAEMRQNYNSKGFAAINPTGKVSLTWGFLKASKQPHHRRTTSGIFLLAKLLEIC